MSKSEIIRKLTSRKLWLAIALFVSGVLTAVGKKETAETVAGLIMQFAAVVGYLVAEGLVDAANKPGEILGVDAAYPDNGTNYTMIHNVEEDINHE